MMLTKDGGSIEDTSDKIKGNGVIGQLNFLFWNEKITHKTTKMVYSDTLESKVTYGSETREIYQRNSLRFQAMEMDFWRKSCGVH